MIKFYGDYEVYSESGVDLTLLRENLRRTPSERLLRNSQGIKLVRALDLARQAGQAGHRQPLGPNMELEVEMLLRQLLSHRVDFVWAT